MTMVPISGVVVQHFDGKMVNNTYSKNDRKNPPSRRVLNVPIRKVWWLYILNFPNEDPT